MFFHSVLSTILNSIGKFGIHHIYGNPPAEQIHPAQTFESKLNPAFPDDGISEGALIWDLCSCL